jgi:LPXTG-site transpeptidase (sortase) family protein
MIRRVVAATGRGFITIGVLLLLFVAYQLWGTGLQYNASQSDAKRKFQLTLKASGIAPATGDVTKDFSPENLGPAPLPGDIAIGTDVTGPTEDTQAASTDSLAATDVPAATNVATPISPAATAKTGVVLTPTTRTTAPTNTATITKPRTPAITPTSKVRKPTATQLPKPNITIPSSAQAGDPLLPVTTLPQVRKGRSKMRRPLASDVLGRMVFPRAGIDVQFVEGSGIEDLKKGPGHYPGLPLPGEIGNAGIACHRTTFGAPCFNLNLAQVGDPLFFETAYGRFRYEVTGLSIVIPKDTKVLAPTPGESVLTITTCHPQYTAKQRLVLRAKLVTTAVDTELYFEPAAKKALVATPLATEALETDPAVVETEVAETIPTTLPAPTTTVAVLTFDTTVNNPVIETVPPPTVATSQTATVPTVPLDSGAVDSGAVDSGAVDSAVTSDVADSTAPLALDGTQAPGQRWQFGWFNGPRSAWIATLLWAFVCALIWFAAWLVARSRKRVARAIVYTAGFLILFLPALYFCFQNLTHLLPENV